MKSPKMPALPAPIAPPTTPTSPAAPSGGGMAGQQTSALAGFSFAPRLAAFAQRQGGRRSMIGG